MSHKYLLPASLTLCLAASASAYAADSASPFTLRDLPTGYRVADTSGNHHENKHKPSKKSGKEEKAGKAKDAKCGEAKCGSNGKT